MNSRPLFAAVRQLEAELKQHKQGTAEHDRISMELKVKAEECKRFQKESQKRLQEQAAAIALSTYQSVNDEIQRIAEARAFRLVIDFSSEPIDQKDNATVLSEIRARQILYQNGLDITEDVIQAVN